MCDTESYVPLQGKALEIEKARGKAWAEKKRKKQEVATSSITPSPTTDRK